MSRLQPSVRYSLSMLNFMYQIHADIFNKILMIVKIARQFREDIKEINVNNTIEEHFGSVQEILCKWYYGSVRRSGKRMLS